MTSPTPHLGEQSLSDLIDGSGSDADRDHVETCAECKAHLDALRDVAQMVTAPPLVSETKRADAVEAALAEFDRMGADGGSRKIPLLADLAAHRAERARRRRGVAVRAAAAAAVLIAIAGVSTLVAEGGGNTTHSASTASRGTFPSAKSGSTGGGVNGQEGAGAAGVAQSAAGATGQVPSLGNIDSPGQLVAAIRSANPAPAPLSAAQPTGDSFSTLNSHCEAPPTPGGDLTLEATLVWKGAPALAFVFATSQRHTALVEANATCKLLATVSY